MNIDQEKFKVDLAKCFEPYFNDLLQCDEVQMQIEAVDSKTDLNNKNERELMAGLMSIECVRYITDYVDDVFVEIYSELL